MKFSEAGPAMPPRAMPRTVLNLISSTDRRQGRNAMTEKPPAAGDHVRDIAPKLADLTRDVLFGDVWERPQLKKRDRSLATVTALIAMNRLEQLPGHMTRALDNGVTREELVELITHLAFYAGWPNAMSALTVARRVFDQDATRG
jgi:4-carboxymuconolactone decarboxylase